MENYHTLTLEKHFNITLSIKNTSAEPKVVNLFDIKSINEPIEDIEISYLPQFTYNELVLSCIDARYIIQGLYSNVSLQRDVSTSYKAMADEAPLVATYLYDDKPKICKQFDIPAVNKIHSFRTILDGKSFVKIKIKPNETLVLHFCVYSYLENGKRKFCEISI